MKRLAIIPFALLGLVACNDDPEVTPWPTAAPLRADEDVWALNAIWPQYGPEVCAGLDELGGRLTPEIEAFAIESFNEGYGRPLSLAGERRLIELLEEC